MRKKIVEMESVASVTLCLWCVSLSLISNHCSTQKDPSCLEIKDLQVNLYKLPIIQVLGEFAFVFGVVVEWF